MPAGERIPNSEFRIPNGEESGGGYALPGKPSLVIPGIETLRRHVAAPLPQDCLPTGIPELDRALQGGLPRGKLIELTGALSSGKTGFLLSLLSQATDREEFVAYVDTFDSLDPESATRAGVDLTRLLWVRCFKPGDSGEAASEKALKAMDILSQAGGFGLIALDLQAFGSIRGWHVPLHAWFRLQRALNGTSTVAVVLSHYRTVGSAAALALTMERGQSLWTHPCSRSTAVGYRVNPNDIPREADRLPESGLNRLQGLKSGARLLKGNPHGTIPIFCRF